MTAIRDIAVITVILFVLGLVIVLMVKVNHQVNSALLNQSAINSTPQARAIIQAEDRHTDLVDYVFLCVFLGFFIGVLVVGWIVSGHPVFAPLYFFILIILVFIAVIFQFAWIDYVGRAAIASAVQYIPITNYLLSHLATFITIMGLGGLLTTYGKPYITG